MRSRLAVFLTVAGETSAGRLYATVIVDYSKDPAAAQRVWALNGKDVFGRRMRWRSTCPAARIANAGPT
jgi:hypothetical protein